MTLEKKIEQKHADLAAKDDWFAPKFKNESRRAAPDRLYLKAGDAIPDWGNEAQPEIRFIEWKAPGRTPTTQQWLYIMNLRKLGFIADWSDNVERGMAILDGTHETFYPPEGYLEPI